MNDEIKENNNEQNEVSLLDFVAILLKYKFLIFLLTFICAVSIFIYCLISLKLPPEDTYMPNLYKPQAEMLINDSSSSGGLSSALSSSGLGGLAGMLGVSGGSSGPSNSSLAAYLITSPTIQDAIIDKFLREDIEKEHAEAIEKLKQKGKYKPEEDKWVFPLTLTREALKEKIETTFDSSTGVFKLAVEDKDPQLACDMINFTVDLLEKRFSEIGVDKNQLTVKNLEEKIEVTYKNILELQKQSQSLDYSPSSLTGNNVTMIQLELQVQEQLYASLKTQLESLKVTMASEQPVFQILEYAKIPDLKSGPSRGKLCIIVTMAAFFVSIFLAFLLNAIENIKADPVAMAKLHPNKKVKK